MARLDQLEERLEILISKALNEVNNGNKPKDLPLDKLFCTFCMLKAWDTSHLSARGYKSVLNQFFKFLKLKHLDVKNLRELTPIIVSEYIRHLKDKRIFSKKWNHWESLSERTINSHIKKIRHTLRSLTAAEPKTFESS